MNASKMSADLARAQNKASRRRRVQSNLNEGISPEIMRQLVSAQAAADESEFEGWVFGTFLDCKVGESSSPEL
jgi:hypothetical protein